MTPALFVIAIASLASGWRLRWWWDVLRVKREIRRLRQAETVIRQREFAALQERQNCWHIKADSPSEAIHRFHLRAPGLSPKGLWP